MNLVSPPNSWRIGTVALFGTACVSFIHSHPLFSWAYGDTTAVSAEYRQSVLVVGLLMASVAAWVSSSIADPKNAHVPAGSTRRGAPLVLSNLSFLILTSGVGFTLGLAPITLHVIDIKVYGAFDFASIASGYAALFAYIAFGYLIGCLLPKFLATPIAIAIAYVMAFFTSNILSPVFDFDVISGLEVPARVSLIRVLWFAACVVSAALASSAWLRLRSTTETRAPALTVAGILLPIVLVAYAAHSYSGRLVQVDGTRPVCESAGTSSVCVHPARARLLPAIAGSVEVMSAKAGPTVVLPSRFLDGTLAISSTERSTSSALQIQGQSRDWLLSARVDIAAYFAGISSCSGGPGLDSSAQDVSSAVAGWLLGLTGETPTPPIPSEGATQQLKILEGLSIAQARTSLEPQMSQIRQCTGHPVE